MKRFFILFSIIILCSACTGTPEGDMTMGQYNRYQRRLETVTVIFPSDSGTIEIRKYENIPLKDIKVDGTSVTFPDTIDHYITYINCPIVLSN